MYLKCFWINIHTPKISCCRKLKNLTNNFNKDYLWLELPWGLITKLKFAICKPSPFVSVDKLVVRTTIGLFIMKKRNQWGLRSDGTRVRVSRPGGGKGDFCIKTTGGALFEIWKSSQRGANILTFGCGLKFLSSCTMQFSIIKLSS